MRTYRSTAMAIIDLTEYRTTALNKRKHVMLNFINLKNAFDTIDHDIFILKCIIMVYRVLEFLKNGFKVLKS